MNALDAVRPGLADAYRKTTEKHKGCAGVMSTSFMCKRCKCNKPTKGRKPAVKGFTKYGYHCADCVEDIENAVEQK